MEIIIIVFAIFFIWLWYARNKYIKEKKKIEAERRCKYLKKILFYIDKPSVNIFDISKAQANENPYCIEIIKKFNDFTLLSDFHSDNIDKNDSVDSEDVFLITSSLKSELIRYKQGFLNDHMDLVKLGYLYAYLGKPDRNYADSYEYLAKCRKDNDILEEKILGNLPRKTRRRVFERDKWHCVLCGEKVGESLLDAHHVKYRSRGGGHELENLVTLCRYCHAGLPYHYKISEEYRRDIEPRNKKIMINIYKKRPELINDMILTCNPLRNILDKNSFIFEEEAFFRKLCFVVEPYYFVEVYELERETSFIYQASENFSTDSPLGKALMGSGIGETVTVEIPDERIRTLKILEIKFPESVGQHDKHLMSCEKCHVKLSVSSSYKNLRCPKCGNMFY